MTGSAMGMSGVQTHVVDKRAGYANPGVATSCLRRSPSPPTIEMSALITVWWSVFGTDPVRASAVVHRAETAADLASALGSPKPSPRSLGRLLAARAGLRYGSLRLVRCAGRHDNCTIWRVMPVELESVYLPTPAGPHDEQAKRR